MTNRKTAVVTGGASGLGAVMADHFAREGYNIAVLDVVDADTAELTSRLAAGSRAISRKCDVSSWQSQADSFKHVYREFGRIDVVCANAGISERGASAMAQVSQGPDAEPEEPDLKVLDVNLAGVIYCKFPKLHPRVTFTWLDFLHKACRLTHVVLLPAVKLATHYMNKNDPSEASRGNIICTASNAGLYAFPVSPLYAASKAGVIGLVRSTAPILQRQKIRINALAPAVLGALFHFPRECAPVSGVLLLTELGKLVLVPVTNIAPDKSLFKNMIITPMTTLVDGVKRLLEDPALNGEVAEIHGNSVTLRPVHDFVDEDSRKNLENFWNLGFA